MGDHHDGRRFGIATPEEVAGKTGLQGMRAMMAGETPAPPIGRTLNFRPVEAEEGRVVFEGPASADLLNPGGTVHGGYLALLLDSCMTAAAQSTAGVGEFFTTVEIKVSFLRPVMGDGQTLRAEGTVIAKTRRTAFAEGRLTGEKGRLLATGSTTAMLIERGVGRPEDGITMRP